VLLCVSTTVLLQTALALKVEFLGTALFLVDGKRWFGHFSDRQLWLVLVIFFHILPRVSDLAFLH
jgi:hypothetical protein